MAYSTKELLTDLFKAEDIRPSVIGSRIFAIMMLLTVINLLFLGGASVRMLHFMDQPRFCGTACHVMRPEWTVYQDSPHARVRCVDCHVGEGAEATLTSKISGMRQIAALTLNSYERPIPTPVHELRPSRETCENCHWREIEHGKRLKLLTRYQLDEGSTPSYTTLSLKIGSNDGTRGQIHWHASGDNIVRYSSMNDKREEILLVEVLQHDGSYKRYTNKKLASQSNAQEHLRNMDCVDCHNRVTHIYEDPEAGVDWRIGEGRLDRSLPYLKQVALEAVTNNYVDEAAAMEGIDGEIRSFYRRRYPEVATAKQQEIDGVVEELRDFYRRNVFKAMSVGWNSYPDHKAHAGTREGCFRCHNPDLVDEAGGSIPDDCTLCHSILAHDSPTPFQFLLSVVEEGDPDATMHEYLQREFFETLY
jgi:nitrate/TMAO reductase-like tetraheme cytochrome c subunit